MFDRLIHNLNLPIGLRLCDRWKDLLNLEVIIELTEFVAIELCTIIEYDGVGDSISADDVLICGRDGCKPFWFNPFSEVVDNHYGVLYTMFSFGKLAD